MRMSICAAAMDTLTGPPIHRVAGHTSATNERSSRKSADPVVVSESFKNRMAARLRCG